MRDEEESAWVSVKDLLEVGGEDLWKTWLTKHYQSSSQWSHDSWKARSPLFCSFNEPCAQCAKEAAGPSGSAP